MTVARAAAIGSLVVAVIAVAVLMFSSSGGETYVLRLQSANQLVKGNSVKVGGLDIGKVTDISLSKDNQANVKVDVNDEFAPLHEGTTAIIRQTSLPSVANRYIALTPGPNNAPKIPGGGVIAEDKTTNVVDLDQLFNTLEPKTRKGLQGVLQGFATWYAGQSKNLGRPTSTSARRCRASRRWRPSYRDQKAFTDFIVNGARAVSAIAERSDDLTNLVSNGNTFARAIAQENASLDQALAVFPATLQRAARPSRR